MTSKNNKSYKGKKRGPKVRASDEEMKRLALQVKNKYKHQKVTYLLLQTETGIGRNTWKRRLEHFIEELNNPVIRSFDVEEGNEAYFPNVESIFDAYGNDKQAIINELHKFELLFQDIYKENKELKEEIDKLNGFKEKMIEYKDTIHVLKQESEHYRTLYEKITVTSTEPVIAEQLGITNNLLEFKRDIEKNTDLTNLNNFFPDVSGTSGDDEKITEKNKKEKMKELEDEFGKLF